MGGRDITSRAARSLLEQGNPVRVVGRNAVALAALKQLGAQLAIGDARDAAFLTHAFEGAQALYAMIPTAYDAADMRLSQAQFGTSIATAIGRSGVRRVVNLSSVGAELAKGTGPIAGLHEQEQRLNALTGLDLLHLRPGYFMANHLHAAGTIAALVVYASLERSDVAVPMIATQDIAAVVARELVDPSTHGVLYLHAPRHYTFLQVHAPSAASTRGSASRRTSTAAASGVKARASCAARSKYADSERYSTEALVSVRFMRSAESIGTLAPDRSIPSTWHARRRRRPACERCRSYAGLRTRCMRRGGPLQSLPDARQDA